MNQLNGAFSKLLTSPFYVNLKIPLTTYEKNWIRDSQHQVLLLWVAVHCATNIFETPVDSTGDCAGSVPAEFPDDFEDDIGRRFSKFRRMSTASWCCRSACPAVRGDLRDRWCLPPRTNI
ncbi:unnamed protein product [Caenorhabditis auriculariae]|uniref:Uncharacterized protein n=1 Tax=Caenorhabditis auriculariae TaxID=2777116 RepID=A0A8S1HAW3_9PELO|nr:unnamed protein product [Caenorhabditis auriculariae]